MRNSCELRYVNK